MTKTHNDLDAILQLLQEKEKDLELAAKIGQSLLERNKQLLAKTEAFEEFVSECGEKETQLQHEVTMKNELLHKFMKDRELEDLYSAPQRTDEDSNSWGSESSCRDDSINTLRQKCQTLEEQNSHLILEALQVKEETASVEMKEQQLVLDCVKQLVSAKDQITELTDEISQKAEDNIRQQEEITHLISTVVDLQKRHKQLSVDNEDLQSLLATSQANQSQLKSQVDDLQDKYHECLEMLLENQREVKKLNTRFDSKMRPLKRSPSSSLSHYDSRDSIALEIEESVKRDLTSQQEKREHTARVMETVRAINTSKGSKQPRIPRAQELPQGTLTEGAGYHFTPAPGGVGLPEEGGSVNRSQPDRRLGTHFGRRSFRAPEKLQIVKPIKGSVTLHKWKKLANPTLNIAESRPGVHVKGEDQEQRGDKEPKEQTDTSDVDPDDYEEDEPLQMRFGRTSEGTHLADTDEEDEDGLIHMRVTRHSDEGTSPALTEKKGNVKSGSSASPSNLGLIPLVSGQGFQRGLRERGADSGGILTHLLNSPSSTAPATSSVGQVLADVLQKASEAASHKEPSRAESLRNLANYFSEKERGTSTSPVKVNNPAPVPVVPHASSPGGGILLSRILGTSGLSADLTIPTPVTTTARTNASLSTTATTSTSTTPSILTRGRLVRNSSGSNLLNLAQGSMSDDTALKRFSLDSSRLPKSASKPMELPPSSSQDFSQLRFPTLRRRASSGDLQEFGSSANLDQLGGDVLGARLYRSSSSGNIKDLSGESSAAGPFEGGFFGRLRRTPSIGSLTDLVQRSNFSAIPSSVDALRQHSTSLEPFPVLKPSGTPPSPSSFDQDGGHFFGRSLSSQNPPSASAETVSGAVGGGFFAGARLSTLAGVRGFWAQGGSKSLDSASPPPTAKEPSSEERLQKINKAFTFEDFGGLGLMSFFGGGKSRWSKGDGQ